MSQRNKKSQYRQCFDTIPFSANSQVHFPLSLYSAPHNKVRQWEFISDVAVSFFVQYLLIGPCTKFHYMMHQQTSSIQWSVVCSTPLSFAVGGYVAIACVKGIHRLTTRHHPTKGSLETWFASLSLSSTSPPSQVSPPKELCLRNPSLYRQWISECCECSLRPCGEGEKKFRSLNNMCQNDHYTDADWCLYIWIETGTHTRQKTQNISLFPCWAMGRRGSVLRANACALDFLLYRTFLCPITVNTNIAISANQHITYHLCQEASHTAIHRYVRVKAVSH